MPDLSFNVTGVDVPRHVAVPQLAFDLAVQNETPEARIHSITLHCQIRFEAPRRTYSQREREQLHELFGAPDQWNGSVRSLLWTHADMTIPPVEDETTVRLPVECSYDLHVAASKYFYALEEGDIPLRFLFSGTCFYRAANGHLQVGRIARSEESSYRMPVDVWDQMIEHHYPNTAWLYLRKDVFDRLYAYKRRHGLPTWEQALEAVLPEEDATSNYPEQAEGLRS